MSIGTTVLWGWLFGLVLTVGSFGSIFGLIPKLQNSLTFVWKLIPLLSSTEAIDAATAVFDSIVNLHHFRQKSIFLKYLLVHLDGKHMETTLKYSMAFHL